MFYSEYSGVVPDIQIMAKGIAGGLPLSAIVAKNYVMKGQKPGSMGGTYCKSRERERETPPLRFGSRVRLVDGRGRALMVYRTGLNSG